MGDLRISKPCWRDIYERANYRKATLKEGARHVMAVYRQGCGFRVHTGATGFSTGSRTSKLGFKSGLASSFHDVVRDKSFNFGHVRDLPLGNLIFAMAPI